MSYGGRRLGWKVRFSKIWWLPSLLREGLDSCAICKRWEEIPWWWWLSWMIVIMMNDNLVPRVFRLFGQRGNASRRCPADQKAWRLWVRDWMDEWMKNCARVKYRIRTPISRSHTHTSRSLPRTAGHGVQRLSLFVCIRLVLGVRLHILNNYPAKSRGISPVMKFSASDIAFLAFWLVH